MIEFGNTLRQAREQKGLTTKQVAETTHMMVQLVEDLENERFSRIAAPIYGRGFVKLYCEAVGLDPKPLVSEFMEIFNGNRPATIRRREAAPQPAPAPAPAPAPVPMPEPVPAPEPAPEPEPALEVNEVEEEDGIIAAAADPLPPETVTAAEPPPVEDSLFDFAQRPEPAPAPSRAPAPEPVRRPPPLPAPSRYAAPAPIDKPTHLPRITIPPAALRFLALAGGAVILLWLLFAGIRAVVSALGSAPEPAAETPAEEAGSPRQPMSVPPLYID